ncbi:bactofilin family protein [Aestuariispira insulae]|nr:polymer-forming cytoskeletal protein [Aestuariispira insulae]
MFTRAKSSPTTEAEKKPVHHNQLSVLAQDLAIVGNLVSDGDIQIDGKVDGDVRSSKLTVGETAIVTGTIYGDHIRIAGTVKGEIVARVVVLTATARVTGDIRHDSLSIEAGAYVQGLCKRVEPDQLKQAMNTDQPENNPADSAQATRENTGAPGATVSSGPQTTGASGASAAE